MEIKSKTPPRAPGVVQKILSDVLEIKMDSKSTSAELDRVDFSKFSPRKVLTPDNGATLAAMATAAYATPSDQKKHLKKQEAVESVTFLDSKNNKKLGITAQDTGTQLTLVETKNALLIAARGTTPPFFAGEKADNGAQWQDYATDLAAAPVPNYDGSANVHMGFKLSTDAIWDQLKPHLEAARAARKAIHMAGHSLGAAVALMLADRMHDELGAIPQSVIRTGGPDVGWAGQKKHLEEVGIAARTVNFVNQADPVAYVLPKGETVGTRVYFDRNGNGTTKEGSHTLDRLLGTAKTLSEGKLGIVHHHVPQEYNLLVSGPQNKALLVKLSKELK